MAIEAGSVVYLKSGGRPMTVERIYDREERGQKESVADLSWDGGQRVTPIACLVETDPGPAIAKASLEQQAKLADEANPA